MVVFDKMWARW